MKYFALLLVCALDGDPVFASDLGRFPPLMPDQTHHNWTFGRDHVAWLEKYRAWDGAWLNEAKMCCRAWDLMDDCIRMHPFDENAIKCKLLELRVIIGREAYRAGQMPEIAPVWRFVER